MSAITVSAPAPVVGAPARAALEAAGGFALLGVCAGLGAGAPYRVPSLALTALIVPLGAWVVTGLSVLVVHQFLDLDARPEDIAAALGQGFVRTGQLAASLAPVMLFMAATSDSRMAIACLLMGAVAACGLPATARQLRRAEPQSDHAGFRWLIRGWLLFTTLVGLRIGLDLVG